MGAGMSAAPNRIRANAAIRTPIMSTLSPSGSPKTASPATIVDRFAATDVTAITVTPSPICRLRAEAKNEKIAAVTMIALQGLSKPTGPLSRSPESALICDAEPEPRSDPEQHSTRHRDALDHMREDQQQADTYSDALER